MSEDSKKIIKSVDSGKLPPVNIQPYKSSAGLKTSQRGKSISAYSHDDNNFKILSHGLKSCNEDYKGKK